MLMESILLAALAAAIHAIATAVASLNGTNCRIEEDRRGNASYDRLVTFDLVLE